MEIVIIGTGGMAKELWGMLTDMGETVEGFVAEDGTPDLRNWQIYKDGNETITGFTDEKGRGPLQFCDLPVLGFDSWFVQERPACDVVIANGSPAARRKIRELYERSPHRFPHFIHPAAVIFGRVTLGQGSTIMPGGVIMPDTWIGRYCHVNMGVTIGHDCEIGDYCVINHNAGISGNVRIGNGVLIGAGATIIENHTIGDGATVGAGAVVTKDVPAGETWVGCPARPLERQPLDWEQTERTHADAPAVTLAEVYKLYD